MSELNNNKKCDNCGECSDDTIKCEICVSSCCDCSKICEGCENFFCTKQGCTPVYECTYSGEAYGLTNALCHDCISEMIENEDSHLKYWSFSFLDMVNFQKEEEED